MRRAERGLRFVTTWVSIAPSIILFCAIILAGCTMSSIVLLSGLQRSDSGGAAVAACGFLVCGLGALALHNFIQAWNAFNEDGGNGSVRMRSALKRTFLYAIVPVGVVSSLFAAPAFLAMPPSRWLLTFYFGGAGLIIPMIWMALSKPSGPTQSL